jgi:hypothetical protein
LSVQRLCRDKMVGGTTACEGAGLPPGLDDLRNPGKIESRTRRHLFRASGPSAPERRHRPSSEALERPEHRNAVFFLDCFHAMTGERTMARTNSAFRSPDSRQSAFKATDAGLGKGALTPVADRSVPSRDKPQSETAEDPRSAHSTGLPSYMLSEIEYIRTFGY